MRPIRCLAAALTAALALGALPALAHGDDHRGGGRGHGDRHYEERDRGRGDRHGHWGYRQPPRQVIVVERGYRRPPPPRVIYVEPAPVYQRPQINIVLPLRF